MLDFYIIPDSEETPKPDKVDKLDYAGGLELEIFYRLKKKGIIDSRFGFFSDFRWDNQLVKQIDSKGKVLSTDTDIKELKRIIDKAINSESGLIAIGD